MMPTNMIPTEVYLTVNYYQIDSKEKNVITALVSFGNFMSPNSNQMRGLQETSYTLVTRYHSMKHSELVIAFALQW